MTHEDIPMAKAATGSMDRSTTIDASKLVYFFGAGMSDGDASLRNLLGGKGANLAEMAGIGLPVPPGFTITTDVCSAYYEAGS